LNKHIDNYEKAKVKNEPPEQLTPPLQPRPPNPKLRTAPKCIGFLHIKASWWRRLKAVVSWLVECQSHPPCLVARSLDKLPDAFNLTLPKLR